MKHREIKIAVVVKSLDPDRGGHENYINRLLRGLLAKNHTICCFAESFGERSVEHPKLSKIRISPCKIESGLRLFWFNFRAKQLVDAHPIPFDLVFTTGNVSFGDVYRAGGGVHETYLENCVGPLTRWLPKHLAAVWLQRRLFKKNTPKILITNSEMVKRDIQRRYDVQDKNLKVVRNGIDLSRFCPEVSCRDRAAIRAEYNFEDEDFICLFTAGGGKRKGLSELLETFAAIKDRRIKLLIVGRTDATKLHAVIDSHSLHGRVFYAGYQQRIERYYGAADCLVFPSKYDAAANVVCEALACGLTVVTTATNGSSELIRDGVTGYVIPRADDFNGLESSITRLAASENRGEMRAAAVETGMRHSMEWHINQFEKVIETYLQNGNAGPNPSETTDL